MCLVLWVLALLLSSLFLLSPPSFSSLLTAPLCPPVHPSMYATEWLMTMFCRGFSFSLALRVWDCFLHSLDVKIVYRVALALLKNAEQELLSSPFEGIMGVLRGLPERTDAEAVMAMAWALPVTRGEIRRLEKEHAEQVAAGGV